MKRLALGLLLTSITGAAYAADLPAPPSAPYTKAPAIVSPLTNWSGFYIGAMGGYASESTSDAVGIKGGFGGGTIGYNWQFSQFVASVEADGAFGSISQSLTGQTIIGPVTVTAEDNALATFRGRLGVAFDQVLLYGTGGLAVEDFKVSGTALGVTVSSSNTQVGWTAGAGVEWMFMPRWSLKAEYLYRRFDNVTVFGIGTGASMALNSGQVGVNYHF